MAYETAGASSVNDLIDKLRIFAVANGWTLDFNGVSGLGSGVAVLLHKGSVYVGFATDTSAGADTNDPGPRVHTYYFTGAYSGGAGPLAQAGHSGTSNTNNMTGPFGAYHFFADRDYLHVVVETTPGSFRHFGVGVLEKAGAVTTATYAYGTAWHWGSSRIGNILEAHHVLPFNDHGTSIPGAGTVIRADSDSISPRHVRVSDTTGVNGSACGGFIRYYTSEHRAAPIAGLALLTPSALTGRAPLLPLFCSVSRPSGNLSIIGAPYDMRFVRVDNMVAGELITLGPDSWKCFPVIRKNAVAGQENSQNFGYAYRVVP